MEYLTINEACNISGKSNITIRRLIKKLKPPDIKKQKTATDFMYLLSKDFLTTHLTTQEPIHLSTQKDKNITNQAQNPTTQATTQLIDHLTTQNEFLKEQIIQKDKQIEEINSRLKEANVINMGLQARLSLPDKKTNIFTRLFFKQKEKNI
jgi:hypothetical protein